MIKNLLDADEDESTMERAFAEDKQANENEFEKFAAPFSKIEDDADLLEIPELKTVSLVSEVEVNASEPINPTPPTVSFAAEPTIFESSIEKNKNDDVFFERRVSAGIVRRNDSQKRNGLHGGDYFVRFDSFRADYRLVRRSAFRNFAVGKNRRHRSRFDHRFHPIFPYNFANSQK